VLVAGALAVPAGAADEQVVQAPPAPAPPAPAGAPAPAPEARTCPTAPSAFPGVCAPDGSSVNTLEDIVRGSAIGLAALALPAPQAAPSIVWKPVKREPTARP
jgi:hypothetical protein